ncbi:MAG: prolipoprotein diacylglyceryl transferase [Oscillospiraceae bacterium]|jgi:phosphatidylglycerol:prolipoprotein diacylglycerol transferase|nr:prolipoprotein diacylglyceryl transferase [Oscillospiraceae bacterium]
MMIFNNPTITFPLFGDGFVLNLPSFFTIFGFNIYYYGVFITLGYAVATLYLVKRRKLFGLTTDNIMDLLLITVPCGIVGARIYYMLFNFDRFFGPGQWGNILAFRDGGLAVYGGIIASIIVFILYSRIKKIPLGNLLDAGGFALLIGQAIGRWGNFINREAFGAETDLPWKMGLTFENNQIINGVLYGRGSTYYFHPTFLYESLWCGLGLLLMHIFSKVSHTKYPGQYFLFYVTWYGFGRFMIESLRMDSLLIPGTDLRASQWLAALSCLTAISILIINHFRNRDKINEIESVINKYVKEPNEGKNEEEK